MNFDHYSDAQLVVMAVEAKEKAHSAPKCISGTEQSPYISGDAYARHGREWVAIEDELDRRAAVQRGGKFGATAWEPKGDRTSNPGENGEATSSSRDPLAMPRASSAPNYDDVRKAVSLERECCARIADSFAKEYGPEVGRMAKRIADVIRRQPKSQ